jgi:diguanylate cyclase (GGDEF)-like protein
VLAHAIDVTDRMDREAELVSRALQDPLTGLPNRTHLVERLSSLIQGSPAVIVYLDLDGFKPVNDRFGHSTGDQVLVRIAERMRGAVRSGDLLARVGGDEFVAVLHSDLPTARLTAQRLIDVLGEPVAVGDVRVTLGASAGLSVVIDNDWEAALEAADVAMYVAKRSEGSIAEG